jgi:hypothetical protein
VSRLAIAHELRRARQLSLLRISLHPQDVRGDGVLAHWRALIGAALAARLPVTKGAWVRRVTRPPALSRGAPQHESARESADAQPATEAS